MNATLTAQTAMTKSPIHTLSPGVPLPASQTRIQAKQAATMGQASHHQFSRRTTTKSPTESAIR